MASKVSGMASASKGAPGEGMGTVIGSMGGVGWDGLTREEGGRKGVRGATVILGSGLFARRKTRQE